MAMKSDLVRTTTPTGHIKILQIDVGPEMGCL